MKTIVIGSLNTDLVATGIKQFPKAGEHVYGKELLIGPGGKSRNIADMIAHLAPKGSVAMVGRTVRDPYGLWKFPIDALTIASVNTDYVVIEDYHTTKKLPGIALIPVDIHGNNEIFVLPGISDDFSVSDIDNAAPLFAEVGKNKGVLALTLECPLDTVVRAVELANKHDIKVLFDPGGIAAGTDVTRIVESGIYLIKPNEHEAKMLTGVEVKDFGTAKQAAQKLHAQGIENVLITVGANGAYLFTNGEQKHIPIPDVGAHDDKDETGSGDQTMAALVAFIQDGKTVGDAALLAVLAGTLQFHRSGIKPVTLSDLSNF